MTDGTANGRLKVGATPTSVAAQSTSLEYGTNKSDDTGLSIKLASDGTVAFNISTGSADLLIDVQGYFSAGTDGSGYTPLTNTRVYTSWDGQPLAAGEHREIQIQGISDVPDEGAGSALLTVSVGYFTAPGTLSVFNAEDEPTDASNLAFKAPYSSVNAFTTAAVELSEDGKIAVSNNSAGTVHVTIAAQGWFASNYVDDVDPTADNALDGPNPELQNHRRESCWRLYPNPLRAADR